MASVQEHLKLKRVSIDDWSIRERLCLSSSVLRSGDQNWMSVSRSVKVFGEPNRPDDWFSQKNCAVQYSSMLEKAETPKRKKRSSSSDKDTPVETVGEIIMRKCTNERIDELQKMMEADKLAFLKLQREVQLLQGGNVSNEQLASWAQEMDNEEKQKEIDAQNHELWLKERERKKALLERAWKPHMSTSTRRKLPTPLDSIVETSSQSDLFLDSSVTDSSEIFSTDVRGDRTPEPKPTVTSPTSPFLTSLLKNPSPTKHSPTSILHSAITSQRSSTPTITSLLSSSPGVPQIKAFPPAPPTVAAQEDQAGVPTLSMLLQLPPGGTDKLALGSVEAIHHPQHQQLQLSKESETDEILDVVEVVDQSLVEVDDMEPIEIGLEEIIADLEQAAATHEHIVKDQLLQENIVMEDIPQTPTNVDTFHKIFDDFYAMNVVKPKDSVEEETKPSETNDVVIEETLVNIEDVKVPEELVSKSTVNVLDEKGFVSSKIVESEKVAAPAVGSTVRELRSEEQTHDLETIESSLDVQEVSTMGPDVMMATQKLSEESDALLEDVSIVVNKEMSATIAESSRAEVEDIVSDLLNNGPVVKTKERFKRDERVRRDERPKQDEKLGKDEKSKKAEKVKQDDKVPEILTSPAEQIIEESKVSIVTTPSVVTGVESEGETSLKEVSPTKQYPDKFDDMVNEKPMKRREDKVEKPKETSAEKLQASILKGELLKQAELEAPITEVKLPDEPKEMAFVESNLTEETDDTRKEKTDEESEDDKNVEMVEGRDLPRDESSMQSDGKEEKRGDVGILSGSESSSQEKVLCSEVGNPKVEMGWMEQTLGSRNRFIRRTATPAIDSLPSSPASVTTDEEKEYRAWKKAIMLVWNSLSAHKYASLFYKPITDDLAPEYSDRVRGQVDLSTIKRHIETGVIKSTAEFQRDVMRMFVNATMYNKTKKEVYTMAQEMQRDSLQQVNDFVATQRLIQSPGDSSTMRRETRTTDANTANPYKRKRESDVGKIAKKR